MYLSVNDITIRVSFMHLFGKVWGRGALRPQSKSSRGKKVIAKVYKHVDFVYKY